MFGKQKVSSEDRQQILQYLARLMNLTKVQDNAAERYNDAIIRSGSAVTAGTVEAAERLLASARQLETQHASVGDLPAVALEAYAKWQQTWLEYRMWCEAQVSVLAAGESATQEAMRYNRLALESSERTRKAAERAELQLMKTLKMNAAEVQTIMRALYG